MTKKEAREIARQFIMRAKTPWDLSTVAQFVPPGYELSKAASVDDFRALTMHEVTRAYLRLMRKV